MNIESWTDIQLMAPNNETVNKDNFTCTVIDGKGYDNIFQFFEVKIEDFDDLIAEVIEDHFGNTEPFAIEYVPELSMYGLLAKDQRDGPMYNSDFHIHTFLDLLDKTITEMLK